MQLSDNAIDAANARRPLPGDAPQSTDPLGADHRQHHGPFAGSQTMIDLIAKAPREHDENIAAAGVPLPSSVHDLLTAAQQTIGKAPDIARTQIRQAEQIAADDRVAAEGKRRLIAESAAAAADQLAQLQRTARANIDMARAELEVAALPKLDAGREAFARQDAGMRLAAVPAGDRRKVLMELAAGGDDMAGLVAGPYGLNVLKSAGLSGRALAEAHRSVIAAATASAASSDDPGRRAAIAHLRTVEKLAGSSDMIGVLARHSRDEILARHGLPGPASRTPNAGAMPRR